MACLALRPLHVSLMRAGVLHSHRSTQHALSSPTGVCSQSSGSGARRHVSRSCSGVHSPPPHPCAPPPRPACRPRPAAASPRAVRVVCCAPPRGARPPCSPPATAPPITCADRTSAASMTRCAPALSTRCGAGQDRVARRLAAAAAARRADYEREVAERRPSPSAPSAPYSLGEDRTCSRATDGREYALPCAPRSPARCGPGRSPPPPRNVPLRPDDACRVSDGRLDPCAHRPRVFVEIDRGESSGAASEPAAAPRSVTSRVMDVFGRGRRAGGPCSGEHSRRRLHSCASTGEGGAGAGGLEAALRERAALAEAGRGRVAALCEAGAENSRRAVAAGRLQVAVPRGVELVSVCVTLCPPPPPPRPTSAPVRAAEGGARSQCGPSNSWLCMKSIQERFTASRRAGAHKKSISAEAKQTPSSPSSPPNKLPSPCSPPNKPSSPCSPPNKPSSPCSPPNNPTTPRSPLNKPATPSSLPSDSPCAPPRHSSRARQPAAPADKTRPCAGASNVKMCNSTLKFLSDTLNIR